MSDGGNTAHGGTSVGTLEQEGGVELCGYIQDLCCYFVPLFIPHEISNMPYCGGKHSDPTKAGRPLAAHQDACRGQLRAYGRRMMQGKDAQASALLRNASKNSPATCGSRFPGKRLAECKAQRRLYGLLPFVDTADDVSFRSYVASNREEAASSFPIVEINHGYTLSVYEHTHVSVRGATVLFLSCVAKGASERASTAYERPQTPGAIGWALGTSTRARRLAHLCSTWPAWKESGIPWLRRNGMGPDQAKGRRDGTFWQDSAECPGCKNTNRPRGSLLSDGKP